MLSHSVKSSYIVSHHHTLTLERLSQCYHNAARALFGSEAEKEKNQQLSRSVALLLGQKLLAVGVFRQVWALILLIVM